ncbi:MAG: GNAT family N-acetyltransferase [Armatimonadetes bacterium]|nr:GNAT family N-acetyltransferase [Armatimonadota bacterium]
MADVMFRWEGPGAFEEHGLIPISFMVQATVDLDVLLRTEGRTVVAVPRPSYEKDYDAVPTERPASYSRNGDTGRWLVLGAFADGRRVGGVVLAPRANGFAFAEDRHRAAVIVDLRVSPDFRGIGIGRRLIEESCSHVAGLGTETLVVETQDTNVPACRLYSSCGFSVFTVDRLAYGEDTDEALIGWERSLEAVRIR